ncbi:MAG: PEP-CTERM sorting domain-containing protein [Armatimonadetes bacterium]|nr:PEP-CTERM sorting domain-containing protein [Armatimonadota bacterium]
MRAILLVALATAGVFAHALVLDDFTDGNINDKIFSGSNATYTAATVPGGFRYVMHNITANPFSLSHSTTVVNGIFSTSSKNEVDADTTIAWGVDSTGSVNIANDLNANLSSFTQLKFNVLSNDNPATITVVLRSGSTTVSSAAKAVMPNMVTTPQSVTFNFSEFAGINFADIDTIVANINTSTSGDLVLDSFEAVPEPGTMIALGLGAAALAARRRKA